MATGTKLSKGARLAFSDEGGRRSVIGNALVSKQGQLIVALDVLPKNGIFTIESVEEATDREQLVEIESQRDHALDELAEIQNLAEIHGGSNWETLQPVLDRLTTLNTQIKTLREQSGKRSS